MAPTQVEILKSELPIKATRWIDDSADFRELRISYYIYDSYYIRHVHFCEQLTRVSLPSLSKYWVPPSRWLGVLQRGSARVREQARLIMVVLQVPTILCGLL
jgi:hypothetical protein